MAFMQSASFDLWMSAMSKLQLLFHLLYIWNALERTKAMYMLCLNMLVLLLLLLLLLSNASTMFLTCNRRSISWHHVLAECFFITSATFSFGILVACIMLLLYFLHTFSFLMTSRKCVYRLHLCLEFERFFVIICTRSWCGVAAQTSCSSEIFMQSHAQCISYASAMFKAVAMPVRSVHIPSFSFTILTTWSARIHVKIEPEKIAIHAPHDFVPKNNFVHIR